MSREYRICSQTVMDTSDSEIIFDNNGISNHVNNYRLTCSKLLIPEVDQPFKLASLVSEIKKSGAGKEYDCIIGLSGGADSTYVAYQVKKLGLRPLAVHLDNGWNSELAVKNIENAIKKLDIDLFTYVIDWEEFKDLQIAYLRASVVDIEVLTDNAITVIINRLAKKYGIKYFLSGTNVATESIMPRSWFYNIKYDSLNIKSIYKKFGRLKKMNTYPVFNLFEYLRYRYFKKTVKTISLLNYLPYIKNNAIRTLEQELEWKDYGGKHWESKFTQFYQAYILPTKFGIDKRRAFLSCLILSNQLTRDEALVELEKELYPIAKLLEDKDYIIKKFNISSEEFDEIMCRPPLSHYCYQSYDSIHKRLVKIFRKFFK